MNRTRLAAAAFAVLFTAASASAETITFTFYTGVQPDNVTPVSPDVPTNVDQDGVAGPGKLADICAGGNLDICANLLHIAPRPCCAGLMQGARRHLAPQGLLIRA